MILSLNRQDWRDEDSPRAPSAEAAVALEKEGVLLLPHLGFDIRPAEEVHFSPAVAVAKNVSFDPATGRVGGTARTDPALTEMLRRFSESVAALADSLFPAYRGRLQRARASFRPAEIAGRQTTWRHDDTRLHIDSFPATPVQGRRILRVFTNVNPEGRVRSWRLGEPFEQVAAKFADRLRIPLPFTFELLRLSGITKTRRSPYDALMLQLHDRMKADLEYQRQAAQTAVDFPAGSTWIAFTDAVSHAAMGGQYQLEQTLLLPVDAMLHPERSPLRILERIKGRSLT
jgi:3-deoxy-D-manno-oct-2-ulosonic acid (Kdo) hydroxylase